MTSRTPQPLVLEYKKRRYDGGPEREMIEQIELQHRLIEQQRLSAASVYGAGAAMGSIYPMPAPHPETSAPALPVRGTQQELSNVSAADVASTDLRTALYAIFILPYVELTLGLSGIFISSIMMTSLLRETITQSQLFRQERNALRQHSWAIVRRSFRDIVFAPVLALRLLIKH